jgi:glycosyltransferase involved in cell wall biosynthesis
MARAVAALGHDVFVYTMDREMPPGAVSEYGAPILRDGVERRFYRQHFPSLLATSFPLYRALAARIPHVDIVHLHALYLFHDLAVGRLCRRHGVPYLLCPHGALDPYLWVRHRVRKRVIEWLFQDRVTRGAAALHFIAEDEKRLAEPYSHGRPGVVVPIGIAFAEYADLPPAGFLRARHPEIGTRRIVLFLGRLNFKKGIDLLIPAFAQASRTHEDLHLVFVGPDDGMKARAERWIAEAGIGSRVTFAGMLTGRDKLAAFADSYCFMLPSYSENFGIALVEAMACGLPVGLSDRVNIWREIVAAEAGIAGPPTVETVAEQLARLAGDSAAAHAMGKRGRELAANRYDWGGIAGDLEAVYRSLARKPPGTAA